MANRYYGVIPNTPENKRILEITMALDARRNVNNEPTYLWKIPLLTGSNRIKEGKAHEPLVGAGFMEMDQSEPLQRPRGMVSPYTQPPNQFILSGTSASYPYYNANELKIVNTIKTGRGWGAVEGYNPDNTKMSKEQMSAYRRRNMKKVAIPELEGSGALGSMFVSGAKTGAKYGAKYGAQAIKTGISVAKTGASAAVTIAKSPAFQAVVSEIANDKDVQKAVIDQVSSLIKGNKTVEEVKDEATETPAPVEGGRIRKTPRGKSDGRAKRAEIVKRIMREKGLKMTDASSYVKKHNLY